MRRFSVFGKKTCCSKSVHHGYAVDGIQQVFSYAAFHSVGIKQSFYFHCAEENFSSLDSIKFIFEGICWN